MAATHLSGPLEVDGLAVVATTAVLASGAVAVDFAGTLASVTGATVTRHGSGGGAAPEVAVATTILTVDDGSGSSSDTVSILAFGPAA